MNLAAAEAGVCAIVLPRLRHRFSRRTNLVRLPLDLGAEARGSLQLVCVRSAYDIPWVQLVADALAAELVGTTRWPV